MKQYINFQKQGFSIFNDVFEQDDIELIRAEIQEIFSTQPDLFNCHVNPEGNQYFTYRKDVMELESVKKIIVSNQFIQKICNVLNTDSIVYFGDSSVMINQGERGFHKDNIKRNDPKSNEWNEDYDIVRVGIYLHDTKSFSGGLQLRKGSHRTWNRWKGKVVTALANKGSFIVWKLTTTHSGNTLILKALSKYITLIPRLTTLLPRFLFKPYAENRIAIFMAFAKNDSSYLSEYIDYFSKQNFSKPFRITDLPKEYVEDCISFGLKFSPNKVKQSAELGPYNSYFEVDYEYYPLTK